MAHAPLRYCRVNIMQQESTPNFWPDRKGEIVRGIVIHCTDGSFESADSWIKSVSSAVSYHYVVKPDGTPVQYVNTAAAAWANGLVVNGTWPGLIDKVNPNLYTISIAYAGDPQKGPTLQQVITMAALIKNLSTNYNLTIDENTVIPHNAIRRDKTCPGIGMDMKALRWLASLQA